MFCEHVMLSVLLASVGTFWAAQVWSALIITGSTDLPVLTALLRCMGFPSEACMRNPPHHLLAATFKAILA